MSEELPPFLGPVEIDDTYIRGEERNKHWDKKLRAGHGGVGKTPVIGIKDRATNAVTAVSVPVRTTAEAIRLDIEKVASQAEVYTGESSIYNPIPNRSWVTRSRGQRTLERIGAVFDRMRGKGLLYSDLVG